MKIHILDNPLTPGALEQHITALHDPCAAPAGAKLVSQTALAVVFALGRHIPAATSIAQVVQADNTALVGIFGLNPAGLPFTVYVKPHVGGAYHCGCDATTFFVDANAQLGPSFNAAEMVEVFEAAIDNGWDCGATNGEALSRALAVALHPELGPVLPATEIGWWDNGAVDYISANIADDRNSDANGCGLLFLYYLHDGLGHGWDAISRAGGTALGDTYGKLTHNDPSTAFDAFKKALQPFVNASGKLTLPANGNPWAS